MKLTLGLRAAAAAAAVCLALALPMAARAQYTTVTTSTLGGTQTPANGTIYWQPITEARIGSSGGQILSQMPEQATVTNGVSSIVLPDALAASPQTCYAVTVIDGATGNVLLGQGLDATGHVKTGGAYGCVQPTGSSWSFDSYHPAATSAAINGQSVFNWQGTWSSLASYQVGDAVSYNGSTFINTVPGNTNNPGSPTSPGTGWSLMAQVGSNAVGTDPNCKADGSGNLGCITVSAGTIDGVPIASQQTGADACAKINAAEALLLSTGGTIDARGIQGTQTCAATVTLSKPTRLLLGAATYTLEGNPGVSVTSRGVSIIGQGRVISGYGADVNATILKSGQAYPLIANTGSGTDGLAVTDMELDGNSVGTYGIDYPSSGAGVFARLSVHGFTVDGILATGGLNGLTDSMIFSNAEGAKWGSDCYNNVGDSFDKNTGAGLHIVSGGCRWVSPEASDNGSHGIYLDGTGGNAAIVTLISPYVDDNGTATAGTDNIRIEGQSGNHSATQQDQIIGGYVGMAQSTTAVATGVHVLNSHAVSISGLNMLGGVLNAGLDDGGIVVEGSDTIRINGFTGTMLSQNPVRIVNSTDVSVDGATLRDTGTSSTSAANSYGVSVDSASARTGLSGVTIIDDRGGTAYSRGISNAGTTTTITGYTETGLLGDSLGTANLNAYLNAANTWSAQQIFEGHVKQYNGFDLYGYADAGTTQTWQINSSTGQAQFNDVGVPTGGSFQYNGTAGVSGTKTAGSCTFTIQGGIITGVSGC